MSDDLSDAKGFDVLSLTAVAVPEEDQLTIVFKTKDDGTLGAFIPSGLIGLLMTQLKAEYSKLSLKASVDQVALPSMQLTGARAFSVGLTGSPVLLLQFDGCFEIAVTLSPSDVKRLEDAIRRLHGKSPGATKGLQ